MDAHGLYLWTVSDAIENALVKRKTSILDAIDGKMLLLIAGVIVAVAVIYIFIL